LVQVGRNWEPIRSLKWDFLCPRSYHFPIYLLPVIVRRVNWDECFVVETAIYSCNFSFICSRVHHLVINLCLFLGHIELIEGNPRLNGWITSCHRVTLLQVFQKWVFVTKKYFFGWPWLSEPTKPYLNDNIPHIIS
jgi:hypothetical protein